MLLMPTRCCVTPWRLFFPSLCTTMPQETCIQPFRGSSILVQIQIALIGILVVVCLFFMWRMITRINDKVDSIAANCACCSESKYGGCHITGGSKGACEPVKSGASANDTDPNNWNLEEQYAEEMMRIFGGVSSDNVVFGVSASFTPEQIDSNTFDSEKLSECEVNGAKEDADIELDIVEQVPYVLTIPTVPIVPCVPMVGSDAISEVDTDNENPLSKTKLKRMTTDKLREICKSRKAPHEGSKQELVDRILGLLRY